MSECSKFDRLELAGSLGDLGAPLTISISMVVVNGLSFEKVKTIRKKNYSQLH